ncbi:MAG: biotin/lipoyl-containing protein, partial [Paracoccaceae bacterium]
MSMRWRATSIISRRAERQCATAWQLRVAMGEALPMAQADLSLTGHAFEARLYAEDVPAGFLPATGRLAHLAFPKDARADTGVRSGDSISPHYDPMIAKVIVQGADRAEALRRLSRALDQTQVAGTVTNLSFLQALSRHKGFGAGQVDTGLIGRDLEDLVAVSPPDGATRAQMAWAAAGLMAAPDWDRGFALWGPLWRDVVLDLGEGAVTLRVQCAGASGVVDLGDTQVAVRWRDSPAGGAWIFGGQVAADWVRHGGVGGAGGDQITVFARHTVTARCVDPLDRGSDDAARGVVEAPMPGLLRAVLVAPGQEVSKGDRLAILEAMKMEHTLTAPRDGIIAEVLGTAGTQVEAGMALVRLQDEDTEDEDTEGQGA